MRRLDNNAYTANYILNDHLGSVSFVINSNNGGVLSQQEYDPWGAVRSGSVPQTTRNYTGQQLDGTGLLFYNARYYDPGIGRFVSADTVVPGSGTLTVSPSDATAIGVWGKREGGPSNPQELNRYSYVNNNPVRYTDPTGHLPFLLAPILGAAAIGAIVNMTATAITTAVIERRAPTWGELASAGISGGQPGR